MAADGELTERLDSWVEVSSSAIRDNLSIFRRLVSRDVKLAAVVKGNAYGHGMIPVSRIALESGADWLGVFSIDEGLTLRDAGIEAPVLVMGPFNRHNLGLALESDLRLTLTSSFAVHALCNHPSRGGAKVHLKLETGTNRQGLTEDELPEAVRLLLSAGVTVEGAFTHFADIEDTTDHAYAQAQLDRFERLVEILGSLGLPVPMPHTACTAATILFPETFKSLVRVGIGLYGLWPSRETRVSAQVIDRNRLGLRPAMTWKARISQIKVVPSGSYVGYGRTFRTTRDSRIGVLPVGYVDGYDRGLSNAAHVLVGGTRAPLVGRVCMNLTMIDLTDIPSAVEGDVAVLLGNSGQESITAEDLARLAGTINYEIVARAATGATRIIVE